MNAVELAIVLLSALLHAAWSVAIKGSRDSLVFNGVQCVFASGIAIVLLATVPWRDVAGELWPVLAATGVAHGLYLYCLSRAFALADISLVYPIARSTPAFLPLFAAPLLGESISLAGGLGIATVVAGMWFVSVGRDFRWRALRQPGLVYAYGTLLATVAYGLLDKRAMVVLAQAPWTSPVPRPIFYFFVLYLACSLLFLPLLLWRTGFSKALAAARREWKGALLATGFGVTGYGLILQALRTAPASYVVAVRQASVFFVLTASILWLGERPGRLRVLGAGLTVAGVALIAVAP